MAAPGEKSFCVLEYRTINSVDTVQRAFRAKYAKDPPKDKTIRAWYKQFTETGCLCKQKSSGRPLNAEDDVERVWASFVHSLKKSTELQLRSFGCGEQQWRVLCGGLVFKQWRVLCERLVFKQWRVLCERLVFQQWRVLVSVWCFNSGGFL